MEWFIRAFIRASLMWFVAGIVLGVGIVIYPSWIVYRPAHAHMTVAGFLTMLVFGVGYQLLPRMFGHALHSRRMAIVHLYLANVGLGGLVIGFLLRPYSLAGARCVAAGGGALFTLGVALWVWNLWRTFDQGDARRRGLEHTDRKPLPTVDN